MANVPSQFTNNIDIAFNTALINTNVWPLHLAVPFSLSTLLNAIEATPGSGVFTTLGVTTGLINTASGITALTLMGNTSASGGPSIILDNMTAATGQTEVLSVRSGGVELLNVNSAGDLTFASSGSYIQTPGYVQAVGYYGNSTPINLYGQSSVAGPGVVLENQTTLTSGSIAEFNNAGSTQFSIAFNGHLIPQSAAPSVGSFATNFGTTTAVSVAGSDAAGIISFTTGTSGGSIVAGTACCVVTLANPYSSVGFVPMVSYAQAAGTLDATSWYAVPGGSGSSFTIYNTVAFTPGSTTAYQLQFLTVGAGATY